MKEFSTAPTGIRVAKALEDLDCGMYRQALAVVDATEPDPHDPDDTLLRAEVALYLDHFAEASSLVQSLGTMPADLEAKTLEGARARRRVLIEAEAALLDGRLAVARPLFESLAMAAAHAADATALVRCRFDVGRMAKIEARYADGTAVLRSALELARAFGNQFYEGRIAYFLGLFSLYANDHEAGQSYLTKAIALLTASEDLKCRAAAENLYGCVLADLGRFEAALEVCEHAESTFADLGVIADMLRSRVAVARTLMALGRFQVAEASLRALWQSTREIGSADTELIVLKRLAVLLCAKGSTADAVRVAAEALRLAEISGIENERLEARLLVARAAMLAREPAGLATLEGLVGEVDRVGSEYLRAEARIYLARAYVTSDPIRARHLCDEVASLPVTATYSWLRLELERVEADLPCSPVQITSDGVLLMDRRRGWADLALARDAMERYWLEAALEATGGNASAAARLLGVTRNQMHYLVHTVLQGEQIRPSRAAKSGARADRGRARRHPTSP